MNVCYYKVWQLSKYGRFKLSTSNNAPRVLYLVGSRCCLAGLNSRLVRSRARAEPQCLSCLRSNLRFFPASWRKCLLLWACVEIVVQGNGHVAWGQSVDGFPAMSHKVSRCTCLSSGRHVATTSVFYCQLVVAIGKHLLFIGKHRRRQCS